jgi:hypothetical protein
VSIFRTIVVVLAAAAATGAAGQTEPAPRKASPAPFRLQTPPAHVSAARELPDGRVIVTDAVTPAVLLIDPATGAAAAIGSIGAGEQQYVRPGGLYAGSDGSTLLLDRAQARVMVISPAGAFTRTYSIAVRGTQSSSDADRDLQQIDARGFAYFTDRAAALGQALGGGAKTIPLVRFDPASQGREKIADLGLPESRTIDRGDGVVLGRSVIGAPADGFGVAPDGRVAIVRGEPYRVDWIGADGALTRGPAIAFEPVPMTEADKQAFLAANSGRGSVGVGLASGGRGSLTGMEPAFAATKAPFTPTDVIVSPDAQVWVMRSRPAGATAVTYDVFDARGRRTDRLEFPDGSRVVGFGKGSVYVRETDGSGRQALRKYAVR